MKNLIVFTNSYPYGNAYNWLDTELEVFKESFGKITIIPYTFENNPNPKTVPDGIEVTEPLFEKELTFSGLTQLFAVLTPRFFYYIREFFSEKVYTNSYWFKSWVKASLQTEQLLKHTVIKSLIKSARKDNTVLYFYWGNNQALLVPFLKPLGFRKILVRFHGFDLYKERLGGYQPYRRPLLRSLDIAAMISTFGKKYLEEHYSDVQFRSNVFRLGTGHTGLSKPSEDGIFRIISCARMIRLKRIDLIPEVLGLLDKRIEWTHIGDGDEAAMVREACVNLPENIDVKFMGQVPGYKVPEIYVKNPFDLFISVSLSEGIPVSIMEALSAGIPVLSTDVGGIAEIIDEQVGSLIPVDSAAEDIAMEINRFILMKKEDILEIRDNACRRYRERCDSRKMAKQLVKQLLDE